MNILGLDLSLTGTGIIKLRDGSIVDEKLIRSKKSGERPIDELERLLKIVEQIDVKGCDLVSIEGMAFMVRKTSSLVQLAALNYFVRKKLYENNIKFIIVAPTTLKKFITGKGNSEKDTMFLEIYKRYGLSFTNNNIADAFSLAKVGQTLLDKNAKLPEFQKDVINLIKKQYE